jgi:hypothetical protein
VREAPVIRRRRIGEPEPQPPQLPGADSLPSGDKVEGTPPRQKSGERGKGILPRLEIQPKLRWS